MLSQKKAFSILELSIVIVIISLMLSAVLVSKQLILMAQINKAYEEYLLFEKSIAMFKDRYECLPGDCNKDQIPDLVSKDSNLISDCLTEIGDRKRCDSPGDPYDTQLDVVVLGTGRIEVVRKRTCMFRELQLATFIDGVSSDYASSNASVTDSIAGLNIPYTKFSRNSAWDFRQIGTCPSPTYCSGAWISPMELGCLYKPLPGELECHFNIDANSIWYRSHVLLLRDANLQKGFIFDVADGNMESNVYFGVTSLFGAKLDLKFDDGEPFTGRIVGGGYLNSNIVDGCTNLDFSLDYHNYSQFHYTRSKNINKGCIMSFLTNVGKY